MNTAFLFPLFLTLHLTALTVLAGTTLIDFISYQTFWKVLDQDRQRSVGLLLAMNKFALLLRISAPTLILSGIGMMALTHGVFGEQLWFRIKFFLVVLLIANGLLTGRRQGLKLRKALSTDTLDMTPISQIKATLKRFHIIQLVIIFAIIFLSAFKFN
jgi:uncharacterized membrane protein SirB2